MLTLIEGNELNLNNVFTIRKKITYYQIQAEIELMEKAIQKEGAKKIGPVVTTTFGKEIRNGVEIVDIEILIPIDKKIKHSESYRIKDQYSVLVVEQFI